MEKINAVCLYCGKRHDIGIKREKEHTVFKGERVEYDSYSLICDRENEEFIPASLLNQNIANIRNAYFKLKGSKSFEFVWYTFNKENPPKKNDSSRVNYLVAIYSRQSDITNVFTACRNDNCFTVEMGGYSIDIYDNDSESDDIVFAYAPLDFINVPDVPERLVLTRQKQEMADAIKTEQEEADMIEAMDNKRENW